MQIKHGRITLVATWLFFVAASMNPTAISGFTTQSVIGKRSHKLAFPEIRERSFSLGMSGLENEPVTEKTKEEPQTVAIRAENIKAKQDAFLLAYKSVSLIWYSIGIGATMSMALNLFGYAFVYTKKDGFRIDTIQQLRVEQQLKNHKFDDSYYAMKRAPKVSEPRPPSQLPQ